MYAVVLKTTGMPILPMDCNGNHEDQGFIVYRTEAAAIGAMKTQCENWLFDHHELTVLPLEDIVENEKSPALATS